MEPPPGDGVGYGVGPRETVDGVGPEHPRHAARLRGERRRDLSDLAPLPLRLRAVDGEGVAVEVEGLPRNATIGDVGRDRGHRPVEVAEFHTAGATRIAPARGAIGTRGHPVIGRQGDDDPVEPPERDHRIEEGPKHPVQSQDVVVELAGVRAPAVADGIRGGE